MEVTVTIEEKEMAYSSSNTVKKRTKVFKGDEIDYCTGCGEPITRYHIFDEPYVTGFTWIKKICEVVTHQHLVEVLRHEYRN